MFSLSNLSKYIRGGSSTNSEEITITSGKLYLLRYTSKLPRTCVYNDAQLLIRKTDAEFQHQLIISRVYDEGEEEASDEEIDDEQVFLVDTSLKFHTSKLEGKPSFIWNDPNYSADEDYEFVIEDHEAESVSPQVVLTRFAQCAWERLHNKKYTNATENDIKDVILTMADDTGDLADAIQGVKINSDEEEAANDSAGDVALPEPPSKVAEGETVETSSGELYIFDSNAFSFVFCTEDIEASLVRTAKYTYWFNVFSKDKAILSQQVEPTMNAIFNDEHLSLIWNYFDKDGHPFSFSIVFSDEHNFSSMRLVLIEAAYETINQEPWSKVSEAEKNYMINSYQEKNEMDVEEEEEGEDGDIDGRDGFTTPPRATSHAVVSDSEEDEGEREEESEGGEEGSEEEEDDDHYEQDPDAKKWESEYENSKLAVGYNHDRSFVLRGNQIGVFKHTEDDDLEFDTTINRIDDTRGKTFLPSNIMLHEQDQSMILMNPNQPNNLYKMDVEYGKVIEEWNVHDDIPTNIIVPDSKFAPTTANKTLLGFSNNAMYRIDPRLAGSKFVESESKAYASKLNFTCAATTDDGNIAVGGQKGTIQLFDRVGIRAKTSLPALGDPILGIDATSDGRYLVATCKNYLLLVDTKIQDDSKGRNGFQASFAKDKKPVPKRLFLQPGHVVYMKSQNAEADLTFTTARFNTAPHDTETARRGERVIVTSTGPFVITWNLRKVLTTGRGDVYNIMKYPDKVVADNFRFGQDRSIVVTLPNDVTMVQRKELQKPTRKSLAVQTPVRKLRSQNAIVNSPY